MCNWLKKLLNKNDIETGGYISSETAQHMRNAEYNNDECAGYIKHHGKQMEWYGGDHLETVQRQIDALIEEDEKHPDLGISTTQVNGFMRQLGKSITQEEQPMKIEVTVNDLYAKNNEVTVPMSQKIDITDLVTEQLKVKVPQEMPWNVYYQLPKNLTTERLGDILDDGDSDAYEWFTDNRHQLILARAMMFGFKVSEQKFRLPLKKLPTFGPQMYIWYNKEANEFDASPYLTFTFTEQELKDLNAPEWVMKLPREYVED